MKKENKVIDKIKHNHKILEILRDIDIEAYTYIYPCENPDKVLKALLNVINGKPETIPRDKYVYMVRVRSNDYNQILKIFSQFRNRRVLATVRKQLLKYSIHDEIILYLHKQSAYAGVYSLCDIGESPLGEIVVKIKVKDTKEVIYWLTRF